MSYLDTCIITAPNEAQAKSFRKLLKDRIDHGLYPREIDFRVYPDPEAGRVGSGGGTLLALDKFVKESDTLDARGLLSNRCVLIIHAGGESRRMPCFVPEGKIFAPVPVESSSIIPPVLLDLQLSFFLKYPWNKGEVVISSGDVAVDFDVTPIPEDRGDVCGFAKKASVEQGSRHGVYKFDRNREKVVDFYQKASVDVLKSEAFFEVSKDCALDIGIVSLSPDAAASFLELGKEKSDQEDSLKEILENGEASFDIYLEIITACLSKISYKRFLERTKEKSCLDPVLLKCLYHKFSGFELRGIMTRAAVFLHFGELRNFYQSCVEIQNKNLLPFYSREGEELQVISGSGTIVYNSVGFSVPLGKHDCTVIESGKDLDLYFIEGDNLLFGMESSSVKTLIPKGICIDQRFTEQKSICLVYSIYDTFRVKERLEDIIFCGMPMDKWLRGHGLRAGDVWDNTIDGFDLLQARLFFSGTSEEQISSYWKKEVQKDWTEQFRKEGRLSIAEVNLLDDLQQREKRRRNIRMEMLRKSLRNGTGWRNMSVADFEEVTRDQEMDVTLTTFHDMSDNPLLKSYRETLLCKLKTPLRSEACTSLFSMDFIDKKSRLQPLKISVKEDQIVWARSPVRLDIAGGWSDTPPYTLRFGGGVLNVAADLNKQPPIQVFCRRTNEKRIRIHSIDLGITETIENFQELSDYRDPSSPFGLPKAALSLLGMIQAGHAEKTLQDFLQDLGCGLEITLLCAIPKGSGLGTSSILGGTILAALHRFFGQEYSRTELFQQVLQMEQMLTTGGGWQDQIGGIVGGVKYIESKPGMRPSPTIRRLDSYLFEERGIHQRYTLFYTGITRLAKNILNEVVVKVNENIPAYLFTLDRIRRLALDAHDAVWMRDYDILASIISRSWEANKRIHASTTNDQIDHLLCKTKPYYSGAKLLGAGGGGYVLFASKDIEAADRLRSILGSDFEDDKARVVSFGLNNEGLQVTVS
jgi:galactokinase/mevalonate kinase-like predicted kinase